MKNANRHTPQKRSKESGLKVNLVRQSLSIRSYRGLEFIPLQDVRCFAADQKYINVYHTRGMSVLDGSLKQLEEEFTDRFVRIHRNALVSFQHIEGLKTEVGGRTAVQVQQLNFLPGVSRRHVGPLRLLLSHR